MSQISTTISRDVVDDVADIDHDIRAYRFRRPNAAIRTLKSALNIDDLTLPSAQIRRVFAAIEFRNAEDDQRVSTCIGSF